MTRARNGLRLPDHPSTVTEIARRLQGTPQWSVQEHHFRVLRTIIGFFLGHLKDQTLFNLIEHYGIGYDRNGYEIMDQTSEKMADVAETKRRAEEKAPCRR